MTIEWNETDNDDVAEYQQHRYPAEWPWHTDYRDDDYIQVIVPEGVTVDSAATIIDHEKRDQERLALETKRAQTRILTEVKRELNRQLEKWGVQWHDPQTWLAIEMEELGEVSQAHLHARFGKEENYQRHLDAMREEWVQVAAVAVAAIESIDRQRASHWL